MSSKYDPAADLRDHKAPLSPPSNIRKEGATFTNTEPPNVPPYAGPQEPVPTSPGVLPVDISPAPAAARPNAEILRKVTGGTGGE